MKWFGSRRRALRRVRRQEQRQLLSELVAATSEARAVVAKLHVYVDALERQERGDP